MSSMKRITREEEHRLVLQAQAGDVQAREKLIAAHEGMITKTVARYRSAVDIVGGWDSLKQTGYVGFLHALSKFDPTRGVRLMTYAEYWILNELDEELARSRHGISLNRETDEIRRRILNASFKLYQELERWPTDAEIADEVREKYSKTKVAKVTTEYVSLILQTTNIESLDATFEHSDPDGGNLHDVAGDPHAQEGLTALLEKEERYEGMLDSLPYVFKALMALNPFEREVVMRRYGLAPYNDNSDVGGMYTQEKRRGEVDFSLLPAPIIAQQMGVPMRRVTVTLRNAALKMQKAVNPEEDK